MLRVTYERMSLTVDFFNDDIAVGQAQKGICGRV
jgi:hypothetical protein